MPVLNFEEVEDFIENLDRTIYLTESSLPNPETFPAPFLLVSLLKIRNGCIIMGKEIDLMYEKKIYKQGFKWKFISYKFYDLD